MSEIEKCVCGGEGQWDADWISCVECGRESPPGKTAVESWNHDMRGLRLLREVADAWSQCFYPSPYLVNKVFAWAKEESDG